MKKISAIGLLILIALALLAMVWGCSPTDNADAIISKMKSPVIVIGISAPSDSATSYWAITIKDGDGNVASFSSYNTISRTIGRSRHVGDTIK